MKKLILATMVAGACLSPIAAIAGTTLYGSMRYSVNSVDDKNGGTDGLTATDNTSLFGLKGWYGEDTKGFFHLQTGAKADVNAAAFGQRFFLAGIKGGFGKLAYGRMTNAYKKPGFKMDPFYNTAHINAAGTFNAGGATYGLSPGINGFTDNSIEYSTNKIAGLLHLNVGVYIDDTNADEHGTVIGGTFTTKNLWAGVQLAANGTVATLPGIAADSDALVVFAGYKEGGLKAGLSFEQVDETVSSNKESVQYLYLTGTYGISDGTDVSVSFGTVDKGVREGSGFHLGVFHKIAKNTKLFATIGSVSLDATGKGDASNVSIGFFHKFSIKG